MAQDDAFLEAIIADPNDDALRLIYADWLDERDDPRGEFIRVQIELATLPSDDARRASLVERERRLLNAHQAQWLGPVAEVVETAQFRRGLLDGITVGVQGFLERGDELFHLRPIRHIRFLDPFDEIGAVGNCPHLPRIESLDLSGAGLRGEELLPLLRSPHWTRLRDLNLQRNHVGPMVWWLPRLTTINHLRRLDLSGCDIDVTWLEMLAAWPGLESVTELSLDANGLSNVGAEVLAASHYVINLTRLDLAANQIAASGCRSLAQSPRLAQLNRLDLSQNPLGNEGATALARSPHLSNLTHLFLHHCQLGASTAEALAAGSVTNLSVLDLGLNRLGRAGAEALSRGPGPRRLTSLDLSGNEIGEEGARFLAAAAHLAGLTTLRLGGNGLRAFGLKALLTSSPLVSVKTLDLPGNNLGDLGAEVLANERRAARLVSLNLRDNHISDVGAQHLANSPNLAELRELNLTHNDISASGVETLTTSSLSERHVHLMLDDEAGTSIRAASASG
jgi:uncharacterized protein (TIGR02996 family)